MHTERIDLVHEIPAFDHPTTLGRFFAHIFDLVIIFAVLFALQKSPLEDVRLLWISIALGYYIVFEHRFGGTIGKLMLGLRVVTRYGERISLIQSFIRTLFRPLEAMGPLALIGGAFILLSRHRQRFGDLCANTYVAPLALLEREHG